MKNAFTLAETLIVLVIIGVIAGFLIPAINSSKPDKNAIMYRKAFYAVEDAVSKLANDTTTFPDNNIFARDLVANDAVLNGANFCNALADTLNTVGAVQCDVAGGLTPINPLEQATPYTAAHRNFRTTNGMEFFGVQQGFSDTTATPTQSSYNGSYITICVDVNGLENGDNVGCYQTTIADICSTKKDQFRINIKWDGKVFTWASNAAPPACTAGTDWNVENNILLSPTKTTK